MAIIDGQTFAPSERKHFKTQLVIQAIEAIQQLLCICIERQWSVPVNENQTIVELSSDNIGTSLPTIQAFLARPAVNQALLIGSRYNLVSNADL